MKKRLISFFLCLCVAASLLPLAAFAAETGGECGEDAVWSYDAASRTLTVSGTGTISDYWVAAPWQAYAPVIARVVIGEGITQIGDNAFEDLLSLTEVELPDSLVSIGDSAFRGCLSLKTVTVPGAVTQVGGYAFAECPSLTSVNLPDDLAKISGSMFRDCRSLEEIHFPKGLALIEDYAFSGCEALTALELPDGLVSIGSYAFHDCGSLVYVSVPASLIQVKTMAFSSCDALCHVFYRGAQAQRDKITAAMGNTGLTGALWHYEVEEISVTEREICTGTVWNCGTCQEDIYRSALSGKSHSFGDWTVETEASCTGEGKQHRICIVCDYQETQTIPAAGHSFSLSNQNPTCTEAGSSGYVCENCGEERNMLSLPAIGHIFGPWMETQAPTTAEQGLETRTCLTCGAEETRPLDKLEEDPETDPTGPAPDWDNPFVDIHEEAYYYDPVLWAYHAGITTGKDAAHFQPNAPCTRAQIVTFLWRAMGQPEPDLMINPFTDVAEGKYYYKAVLWAVQNGITTGKTFTTFEPDAPCTRAQAVTFLWRAMGRPVPQTRENPFTDVPDTSYYRYSVLWAYENEITLGKTATTFLPNDTCTRGQIVTFLYRTLG